MVIHTIDLMSVIFSHAPLPDWTDLWILYEHDAESFLCVFLYPNIRNFTGHKFLDLSFLFFDQKTKLMSKFQTFVPQYDKELSYIDTLNF